MEIKISLHTSIFDLQPFIRVDLYKSNEAYLDPINHEDEIFNCITALNIDFDNRDYSPIKLLEIVETSVNALLDHAEKE